MSILFKIILVIRTIENFPLAILDKLGLTDGLHVYKIRNKKLQLIARSGSEDMAEIAVVTSGLEYPLHILPKLKNPIIFDVGAYIGDSAIYISDFFKNKCKIFSFEPDDENYRFFKINMLLNNIKTVNIFNIGISNYNGKKYLQKGGRQHDAYNFSNKKNKNSLLCSVMTLQQSAKLLNIKKVDILKMDIEGEEYKIFKDKKSLHWIIQNVHYVFMEYHDVDKHKNFSLIQDIVENNFKILRKSNNILCLENKEWKINS